MNETAQIPAVETKVQWGLWFFVVADTASVAIAIGGFVWRDGELLTMIATLLGSSVVSVLLALLWRLKWRYWLTVLSACCVIAWYSAVNWLLFPQFERQYLVAMSTLGFYMVIGVLLGGLVELVSFLHDWAHRGRHAQPPSKTLEK